MSIVDFFRKNKLEKPLLFGYYGGGNYGDELLMDVMQEFFLQKKIKDLRIYFLRPELFHVYHQDRGYSLIDGSKKGDLFKGILKSKNLVVGGGGIWGLDANFRVFMLGLILFFSWLIGKKIHLIGIGFYNSTNTWGKVSALLAGIGASTLIARDEETYKNFRKINKKTTLDKDLAFYISSLEIKSSKENFPLKNENSKRIVIALRRFGNGRDAVYIKNISNLIKKNPKRKFVVLLMEPKFIDSNNHLFAKQLESSKNVEYHEFNYKPLSLIQWLKVNKNNVAVIAPQYHVIISALISNVQFLPIVYDNKVSELLKTENISPIIKIEELKYKQLQDFMDKLYGKQ